MRHKRPLSDFLADEVAQDGEGHRALAVEEAELLLQRLAREAEVAEHVADELGQLGPDPGLRHGLALFLRGCSAWEASRVSSARRASTMLYSEPGV